MPGDEGTVHIMEQIIALIVLGLLTAGIFVGIMINVRLYRRGAFGMRHIDREADLGAVTLSQEAFANEDYYTDLRSTNNGTRLRQLALYAFIAVAILSMLMIYLSSFVGR
jgi:hypothetical protein